MNEEQEKNKDERVFFLDPATVKVKDGRYRKAFDSKKLEELKTSIAAIGQIQPSVLDDEGFLIAGERRKRACEELGIKLKCIFLCDCDEITKKAIELYENVHRQDLSAQEESIARAEIHQLEIQRIGKAATPGSRFSGQRLEDTAAMLGITKGMLSQDLKIAKWLPLLPELWQCKTKLEMLGTIKKTECQIQWHEEASKLVKQQQTVTVPSEPLSPPFSDSEPLIKDPKTVDLFNEPRPYLLLLPGTQEWRECWNKRPELQPEMLDFRKALQQGEEYIPPVELPKRKEENKQQNHADKIFQLQFQAFDGRLMVGNGFEALEQERLPFGPPNIVFFDPPWGIGLDEKLNTAGTQQPGEIYEDSEEDFVQFFPAAISNLYRHMLDGSHLYCFFGIVHFDFVYETLQNAGFTVNRRPLIWHKPNIRSTRAPEHWPGASYEPIAFARKGNRALQAKRGDVISVKALTPNEKLFHPSAKPPELYLDLLERSAYPGDRILDPMFGSGSMFVACEMMKSFNLSWSGWEQNKMHRDRAFITLCQFITMRDETASKPV